MLRTVSTKTKLEFEYLPIDLSKGAPVQQLKQHKFDIVAGIIKTQNFLDDKSIVLTDYLLSDSLVFVSRRNTDFTSNPTKRIIAIQTGFQVAKEFVSTTFPNHNIQEFKTIDECLKAVSQGKADATIYLQTTLINKLHNPRYETLEMSTAYTYPMETCAAGLAESKSEIINIVNEGLRSIEDQERNVLIMSATMFQPSTISVQDIIYKYRFMLIIICVLFILIILVLSISNFIRSQSKRKLEIALKKEKDALALERKAVILAEQANSAKDSFMSRISHEIRTPLNAIIGYNTIAENEIQQTRESGNIEEMIVKTSDCLNKSNIASKHLLSIINDVLDMSAIENSKIKIANDRFDFKSVITSITNIFYPQAKTNGIEFEVIFDTLNEEWFSGDQMRLNQILTNVISNAVKFTSKGGKVSILINEKDIDDKKVQMHFEISDTGIGMSKEYLGHIWTPFEQEDGTRLRRFGGTGLGLSITKNLIDLMGGQIEVISEENVGSTFKIDLPFDRTKQPETSELYDFSNINALVIDDDINTCDYIQLLLTRYGAKCKTVTSGFDAIKEFRDAKNNNNLFTVCLVDWRMPKMDGIETINFIRSEAENDFPIIVLTAYDFSEIEEKAHELGVNKFIAKPLFPSSLFDLLVNISSKDFNKTTEHAHDFNFNGAQVLLVEDNEMNMEIARNLLESAGLNVTCALNGQEAVTKFEESKENTYKVILMDIQMPVMDGYTATRTIRSSTKPEASTIPIIAMTADAFAENIAESRNAGMDDHISKPIDLQKLFETLEKYISTK